MLTGLQTTRRMDNICWVTSWLPSIWSMMIDHRDSDWSLFNCYSRLGLDPLVIDAPAIPPIFPQTKLFLTRFFLLTHDFNFFFAFLHAQEASGRKLGPGSNKKGLIMVTSKLVVHSHQKTGGSPPTQVTRLWTNQPSARTKQKVEKWLIFLYLFILFSIWFFCFFIVVAVVFFDLPRNFGAKIFTLPSARMNIYIYVYRR